MAATVTSGYNGYRISVVTFTHLVSSRAWHVVAPGRTGKLLLALATTVITGFGLVEI
jgi:hypothetical protein